MTYFNAPLAPVLSLEDCLNEPVPRAEYA